MSLSKEEVMSIKEYSEKYDMWAATISRSLRNGREDFDAALANKDLGFTQVIDRMITAWDVSINFIRTEIKSGRSSARRMGLNRGVDHRQFHPAQVAKPQEPEEKKPSKEAVERVSRALQTDGKKS